MANTNLPSKNPAYSELNALFAYNITLVAMNKDLAQRIVKGYESNLWWIQISSQLSSNNALGDDKATLPFVQELPSTDIDLHFFLRQTMAVNNHGNKNIAHLALRHKFIYHVNHVSGVHRLCISTSIALEIITIAHDKGHPSFARYYEIVSRFWYIRGLTKLLRAFIRHCPQCLQLQIRKHSSYSSFQPIHSLPVPFHTLTLDFMLALPLNAAGFNLLMSVICKFSKRETLVKGKETWSAKDQAYTLLQQVDIIDWGLPSELITNRDPKFLSEF